MKFAIDGSTLVGDKTGIDFITEGVIEGFRDFPEHGLLVYVTQDFRRKSGDKISPNIKFVVINRPTGLAKGLRWYRRAARDMKVKKVDAFISTFTFTASRLFTHTIQIVPDLSPLVFPEMFTLKHRFLYKRTLDLAMRGAWKVATISRAMANEIKRKYNRPAAVIPLSINDWARVELKSSEVEKLTSKYKLPEKFFLSISTIQPRKNYENMIRAFAKFLVAHPDFNYVIVGKKGWKYQQVFDLVKDLNLEAKVKFLDYVPDADLPGLMDAAAGFLYASVYEGFGIPPLNAAYRGVPTLVSNLPVFHEILSRDEAIFVNPHVLDSITDGLESLAAQAHKPHNVEVIEKFNWKNTAKSIILLAIRKSQ